MKTLSYTSARENLSKTMNMVCEDHDAVIITRQNASPVVMLSLEDYESITETEYLLRSPANAKRLLKSIDDLKTGKGKVRALQS